MAFRTLLATLLVLATAMAFAPVNNRPSVIVASKTTALEFGFLKELGLEKPDWLPDFGGKKEEEPVAEAPAEGEEAEAEEAAAAEE
jgi:hypothetical protein